MDLVTKLKGLSYLGLGTVLRSVRYAARRGLLDRRYESRRPRGRIPVGRLLDASPTSDGGDLRFQDATLEVRFLAPDLVRLTWQPGALPLPLAGARQDWGPVETSWTRAQGRVRMASAALEVEVDGDGAVAFAVPGRAPFRRERPPVRQDGGWCATADLAPGERVHGLGFRTHAFDLRGGEFAFWNQEPKGAYGPGDDPLYVNVPVWLTVRGADCALVYHENPFRGRASFRDVQQVSFDGGALRYHVIPGPLDRAYDRFSELTGRPALPPRWALGFHQARWSYLDEAQVREVAEGFRSRGLPLSAIHLDIHYMDGHRVFTVDRARFPDLKGLCADLLDQGVRIVTILDPGVKRDDAFDVYRSGVEAGAFCRMPDGSLALADVWPGTCAFPDFTDPAARRWWGQWYARLADQGVSGFWHDMNEPAAFAAWGACTLPLATRHAMEGRGGDHLEAHNLYGLLEDRAGYEALAALRPDRRPFILSRSGWVGLSRWAWHWTGDSESNPWTLRQTVRIVLSLGLSGIVYTGSDIGGFGGIRPDTGLFVRWFQAQAFLPFFRIHSAFFTERREPWCFGDEALGAMAGALHLRSRLMPLWYTLAFGAHRAGTPLVRPLFWADPADPDLAPVDDAWMVGDALLAAPVLDPDATARRLRLPAGRWHALEGDETLQGGREHVVAAPLSRIPAFARAGAVLPQDQDGRTVLHLFAPDDRPPPGGLLYRDDGDGDGPWRLDRFDLSRQDDGAWVLSRTFEGSRPDEPLALLLRGLSPARVEADGTPLEGPGPLPLPAGWSRVRIVPA